MPKRFSNPDIFIRNDMKKILYRQLFLIIIFVPASFPQAEPFESEAEDNSRFLVSRPSSVLPASSAPPTGISPSRRV